MRCWRATVSSAFMARPAASVAVAEGVDPRNQEHHERGAAERQRQLIAKCEPAIERAADQFRCDELV